MDKYIVANAVISKFCKNYNDLKKDLPIRPSEMGLLNIIVEKGGKFTPLMIAELLEVSKPMITAHISVLEKKGYVYKEYSIEDRRSFYIMPTEKAVILVKSTAEKMGKNLTKLEELIGENEFSKLLQLLSRASSDIKLIKGDY